MCLDRACFPVVQPLCMLNLILHLGISGLESKDFTATGKPRVLEQKNKEAERKLKFS